MPEPSPRISEKAREAGEAAIEALYNRPEGCADTGEIVEAVGAAILPLLCGELVEERDEAVKERESLHGELATLLGPRKPREGVTANDHWISAVAAVLARAEKAEKELEEERQRTALWRKDCQVAEEDRDEAEEKLSEARAEVERLRESAATHRDTASRCETVKAGSEHYGQSLHPLVALLSGHREPPGEAERDSSDPPQQESEECSLRLTAEETIEAATRSCQRRGRVTVAQHLRELLEEPRLTPEADPEVPRCTGTADCKCPYCACPTCGVSFDCQSTPELLGEEATRLRAIADRLIANPPPLRGQRQAGEDARFLRTLAARSEGGQR